MMTCEPGTRSPNMGGNPASRFSLSTILLDFTASSEKLGKPVLSDLKEGKVTLPLIFALQNGAGHDGHPSGRDLVATVLREKGFQSVHPEQITSLCAIPARLSIRANWQSNTPIARRHASTFARIPNTAARCYPSRILFSTARADAHFALSCCAQFSASKDFPVTIIISNGIST